MFSVNKASLKKWVKLLENNPVRVFIVLALIFGFVYVFTLAPMSGTDEFSHFPRVYQISEGTFWERPLPQDQYGGYLPSNINRMINDYRNLSRESTGSQFLSDTQKLNKEYSSTSAVGKQKVPAIFTSVVFYPPWAYLFSVIGVLIARLAHLPLIWYIYLGRTTALLSWIAVTALAIKFMPSGKWFLVTIALLPTSLTQAATISSDGQINSLSWLVIALALALLAKKVRPRWSVLLPLSALMIYLSIVKESYWLIALLPLVIPISFFKTRMQGILWKAGSGLGVLIAVICFTAATTKKVSNVVLTPTVGINVNTKQQMHYLMHHLIAFTLSALWQPFTKSFDTLYLGIVGIYTNRLIYLSIPIIGLLFGSLYFGVSNTKPIALFREHPRRITLAALLIIVGTYLLIAVSFYLTETSVGAPQVNGIYGRYFLPLLPLLAVFPMVWRRKTYTSRIQAVYVPLIVSLIALTSTMLSIQ